MHTRHSTTLKEKEETACVLQADGKEADILSLLTRDTPVKDSEMVTFFMPSGAQAEKTFIDLERGRIGPSASAFTDVTLGEVCIPPLPVLFFFSM